MSTFVGLKQCAEYDIAGTGTYTAFDQLTGGRIGAGDAEPTEIIGIGGQARKVWPMIQPGGTATTVLQTTNLLACAKPSAVGSLPPAISKIRGGGIGDSTAAILQTGCYLRSVKLSCEVDGFVQAVYEWVALHEEYTDITSPAAKQTAAPFAWHAGDVLLDGEAFKCMSWEVTVTTDVTLRTSLDAKTAGAQRFPEWADPGNFKVALSARFRLPLGLDLNADKPSSIGFKFVGVDYAAENPRTFTLDLTGGQKLDPSGSKAAELVQGATEAVWALTANSTANDLDVFSFSLA
jgi:hypothetical protein